MKILSFRQPPLGFTYRISTVTLVKYFDENLALYFILRFHQVTSFSELVTLS